MAIPDYVSGVAGLLTPDVNGAYNNGQRQGFADGERQGFADGHARGRAEGWDAAVAEGNRQMQKQMEYTRTYLADKEALALQVEAQRLLIEQLTARLEGRNAGATDGMPPPAENAKPAEPSPAHVDLIWQYNRGVAVLNAVRSTMDAALSSGAPFAVRLRETFQQHYQDSVATSLRNGMITRPPHEDPAFELAMPKTHAFVLRMLAPARVLQSRPVPQQTQVRGATAADGDQVSPDI